jgi:phage terminase large subunit GpA-like protein
LDADIFLQYAIPCPHCHDYHTLTFGGKEEPHGFKWRDRDPATVRHLCPHCGAMIEQGEYLAVWERGRWQNATATVRMDHAGAFTDDGGARLPTPARVAMHIWTAYSPSVAWADIVREFIAAVDKKEAGRPEDLKTFVNTTLGETYAPDIEQTEASELRARAEPYTLGQPPRDCLMLLAGADTQDNRIEISVWGYGRGERMWIIDHHVVWGSPTDDATWQGVEQYLFESIFTNVCGQPMQIEACAIDSTTRRMSTNSRACTGTAACLPCAATRAASATSSRARAASTSTAGARCAATA